jgi:hypothetical protein
MRQSSSYVSADQPMQVRSEEQDLHALQSRVAAEFQEMPGLRLTVPQAARLFSIEAVRCQRVLGALVDRGELATDGLAFARADGGSRCA